MKIHSTTMFVLGIVAAGCSNNLTEEEARRLVEAQPDFVAGVMCPLQLSGRTSEAIARSAPGVYEVQFAECGTALAAAGMGVLLPPSPGADRLARRLIRFPPSAREVGEQVLVPCASLSLLSVSGITTTGNTAVFRYERELQLNPHVAEAAHECFFELPEVGRMERERTARRDDAGNWSLVTDAH